MLGGTIYFAPPDYHLLIDDGPQFALSMDDPVEFSRPSISVLFETAATIYRERLLAVLLTGAGSDGADGMQAVHAAGGLTVVQQPTDARMPQMPQAALVRIVVPDRSASNLRADEVDAEFVGEVGSSTSFTPPASPDAAPGARQAPLPLFKPPYGEVVAVNLNTGDISWRAAVGDSPAMRNHPALKGVALPERLGVAGAPGAIVTKGGLVFIGGADTRLNAFDAKTGELVHRVDLGRRTSGTPMPYRMASGKQVIVIATGSGRDAALVALAVK